MWKIKLEIRPEKEVLKHNNQYSLGKNCIHFQQQTFNCACNSVSGVKPMLRGTKKAFQEAGLGNGL